ncbi:MULTISPECIES: hypothetical protein [Mycobacterium]|uniref:Secreted protein n=1 Tax=Mycobacterium kiyosense TaxID=2871094 RepID=A0A9P3Q2R1_9MYCO|nr:MULTISPECIES: hypothetical protein [Mycobacterium]BDB42438.1 hypothetical protein IWGMT90018_28840 [Mycobacterium kiyosense]BDE14292.1 hypothetical protein MKCMC460_31520 [Mycobacterium sp. 20KCMC460]GLB81492.1 hypothetical protein SRL2020028_07480 [Mycobacterium kiyosense]GLB90089.1 hypothetical protein SRL2020130_29060 [Mycobacterium kiyosense]GLB93685.1 hypothetical protein SRL2020226_04610 [Mycobacterium kiyosense]
MTCGSTGCTSENPARRLRLKRSAAAVAALALAASTLAVAVPAPARADACGSVDGVHVSIEGCSDVAGTVEQYAPAAESVDPPPGPAGDVTACVDVGRRVSVSGCVGTP